MTADRGPSPIAAQRRRILWTLVAGVAIGSTGHIAAITVATIVANDLTGSTAWSGAPGAAVVFGAATGATLLSSLMARRGRRLGLALGYAVGAAGAILATLAVILRSFPLLLLGTGLIGFGNSSNQLSRYAAADMVPAASRASAIGTVVWASTVGAVVGPNLIGWAGSWAAAVGLPALAGAYLVPVVFVGLAAVLSFSLLRPDPFELADVSASVGQEDQISEPVSRIIRRPAVAIALATMVIGQFVMVLIMTNTPLHMTAHGHGLDVVGLVMSAHTFGMFALSPVSGRLTGRLGSIPVILLGAGVLAVSAALTAVAPADGDTALFLPLFLLGWGWNLGYVAGSALLAGGVSLAERARLQGLTDAFVWGTGAAASMGSGLIAAVAGYTALGVGGLGLVALMTWIVISGRRRLAPV